MAPCRKCSKTAEKINVLKWEIADLKAMINDLQKHEKSDMDEIEKTETEWENCFVNLKNDLAQHINRLQRELFEKDLKISILEKAPSTLQFNDMIRHNAELNDKLNRVMTAYDVIYKERDDLKERHSILSKGNFELMGRINKSMDENVSLMNMIETMNNQIFFLKGSSTC